MCAVRLPDFVHSVIGFSLESLNFVLQHFCRRIRIDQLIYSTVKYK